MSRTTQEDVADRYGLPLDDPQVAVAADTIASLPADERDRVVRALASAVYAYQRTDDPSGLREFARDFAATVTLRQTAGYEEALAAAPTEPQGPVRSVKDVLDEIHR